jgi:hypothetical protein
MEQKTRIKKAGVIRKPVIPADRCKLKESFVQPKYGRRSEHAQQHLLFEPDSPLFVYLKREHHRPEHDTKAAQPLHPRERLSQKKKGKHGSKQRDGLK